MEFNVFDDGCGGVFISALSFGASDGEMLRANIGDSDVDIDELGVVDSDTFISTIPCQKPPPSSKF